MVFGYVLIERMKRVVHNLFVFQIFISLCLHPITYWLACRLVNLKMEILIVLEYWISSSIVDKVILRIPIVCVVWMRLNIYLPLSCAINVKVVHLVKISVHCQRWSKRCFFLSVQIHPVLSIFKVELLIKDLRLSIQL